MTMVTLLAAEPRCQFRAIERLVLARWAVSDVAHPAHVLSA